MRSAECVVVGGGPAGLAAARTAARHGVGVLLVDENAELGGQYYRQLPAAFSGGAGTHPVKEQAEGRRLMDEVRGLGVEVMAGAVAWGIFDQRIVAVATQDETTRIAADTVVLAPGAYDRPLPFPGWTLPGVLTAGGAQNLMKAYRVLPGRRVLVVGSGPLLLVVAHYLLQGGAQVVSLCEASSLRGLWRYAHRLLPHLDFVQQGRRYRRELAGAGVPVLTGHVILRATGTTEVTGATIARCDDDWRPIPGTEVTIDADALVVGYGLLSSLELSRLAGCEHRWEAALGGLLGRGQPRARAAPPPAGLPARDGRDLPLRCGHLLPRGRADDALPLRGGDGGGGAPGLARGGHPRQRGEGLDAHRHGALPGPHVRARAGPPGRARDRAAGDGVGCVHAAAAGEARDDGGAGPRDRVSGHRGAAAATRADGSREEVRTPWLEGMLDSRCAERAARNSGSPTPGHGG
ncbi:MAG: FAD-dependent oxidoreductase [Candidatus Rokubacteria bacterium]|nr:FAD-dependent oxidoreductase [Candidatus Rokubacteria bacterium]